MSDGRHRHPATLRFSSMIGLAAAMGATGAMLSLGPALRSAAPEPSANVVKTLAQSYPEARVVELAPRTSDGAVFTPVYFADASHVVGTAPGPKGTVRLLLRQQINSAERELRSLPAALAPEFGGFTSDGKTMVWMELTGQGESRIWAVELAGGAARPITTDTGDAVLFDKDSDLSLHDGQLSWIAAADSREPKTEVRTIALSGGKVAVSVFDGTFTLAGWPWLSSMSLSGLPEPVELRNIASGARTLVGVQPGEQITCSPTWCRSVQIGQTAASTVIEVMKPGDAQRTRTITGSVAPVLADVMLLDRFEIYSRSSDGNTATELLIYDSVSKSTTVVTKQDGIRLCRNGMLWWSTGDNETLRWHALDLKSLK